MASHHISNNGNIIAPVVPCKTVQPFGSGLLSIGYEIVGVDTVVHIFEDPGTGTWVEVATYTIQQNVNPGYNPAQPRVPTGEEWRNNEQVGRMSLHILNDKPVLIFQSMLDHVSGSVDARWKLHIAKFDPINWAAAPVVRCLTPTAAWSLLKTSGPMIFDSVVKGSTIYCCFNYGADEQLGINKESVGLIKITDTTHQLFNIMTKSDTVKYIFLDSDLLNNKIYLSVLFDQKLIYIIHPYIDLINYLIDLDEVRTCARLSAHLGFIGHVGLTATFPRRISIHNTYFIPVEDDAHSLSWHFYDNFMIFFYVSGNDLRCVQFNFSTYNYKKGNALSNIDPRGYSVSLDDGEDTNHSYSHVFFTNVYYVDLRFDAVIDAPVLELPKHQTVVNSSLVDYTFYSPTESQNNSLHFKIKISRDGVTKYFDSEDDNTNWFYNPTGDHREWVALPESGLASTHFGKPVKVSIRRTDLL